MNVLVTGHDGYIGSVLAPFLGARGHDVTGLDTFLFGECRFGDGEPAVPSLRVDVRDVTPSMLEGFDAVVHLAAVSNDPLGNLDANCTDEINHRGSVNLARAAKEAGVSRFVFASSCSLYGAADPDDLLDESAPFNPVTPYGESKVAAERGISALADDDFSPTFLRNATVYGASPRLRADVVVNNLVGVAYTTGEILLMSDGTPWRPLIHVEDVARTFEAVLDADRELVHDEAYNVGRTEENYQIGQIAEIVRAMLPGTEIVYAEGAGPDVRCYRADFSRLQTTFPRLGLAWDVEKGVQELVEAFERFGLTEDEFSGSSFVRLEHIRRLIDQGEIDSDLRWKGSRSDGVVEDDAHRGTAG